MFLSPRLIAFLLALLISGLTVIFLSFVQNTNASMLFVTGVSSFITSFFLALLAIEILVNREIIKLQRKVQKLKLMDFKVPGKEEIAEAPNPIKSLNEEIFVYVAKKQKEIEELKKNEQFRREFLADVSHELKTPIFAVQGYIHTLLDGAMDDESVREKFLRKAANSLDGLDALVKDLLTLSQMEAGEIRMNPQPLNLWLLLHEIFDHLDGLAKKKEVSLKVKPDTATNIQVNADAFRIEQVLMNLIENAVKYNKPGGKVIVHLEEKKKSVIISVRDTGPGIDERHLSRIFERFYRVEKSRSKESGGTGLGLAIVKHILNAHKASITVMSKPGKGTTFSFKLQKVLKEEMSYEIQ